MPIYEYRCKKCQSRFEVLQSMSADGKDLTCPHCDEPAPERLLSVFASSGNDISKADNSCSPGSGFT